MTAAALNPFIEAAERDFALFQVAQLAGTRIRWWVGLILRAVVFPFFVVLAQFVPFIYSRHIALLVPLLPDVQSPRDLAFAKDALTLYHVSLKEYSRFCLFQRRAEATLDEIEEQLDSLEFVTANKEFLDRAVAQIERRQ